MHKSIRPGQSRKLCGILSIIIVIMLCNMMFKLLNQVLLEKLTEHHFSNLAVILQMLAVTAPIVAFHFIATYFAGQIKKLEEIQDHINDENDDFFVSFLVF